jgi:hypothetical protein
MDIKTQSASEPLTVTTPSPIPAARRLNPAALRLAAVAVVFIGWIAYLVYLVVTLPHTRTGAPLVLSRPQILVSEVDVIAQVDDTTPEGEVTIKEVLYPHDSPLVGKKVHVVNLERCKPLPRDAQKAEDVAPDWTGPGLYLLPLQHIDADDFKVAPTPPSPGYPPTMSLRTGPPRLYPATEAAKAQYRSIAKP